MSKFIELSETIKFVNERIETKELNLKNYISTENMQPNKGGITNAIKLPPAKTTTRYKKEDILISNIRLYFEKIWIADRAGGTSSDILVLRNKKGYNSKFIYYALSDINFFNYADVTSKGTKMPRGDKKAILKYPIPNLNLKDQEKIADILSTYDELIENNNRRIEILEKTAEEIYKEWFVRMRFPGYENTKFIKGIPEAWENVKLEDVCKLVRGISYSTKEIEKDVGVPMLTLKSIQAYGGYNYNGLRFFDGKIADRHYLKENDLVMAITDMTQDRRVIGQVCLIPKTNYDDLVFSADLILLDELKIEKDYMYALLRYGGLSEHIAMFSNGANVLHLNQRILNKIRIFIAPESLRKEYEFKHKSIQKEIGILEIQNQHLIKQRDLLLPRLMNGTIEVK